MCGEESQNSVFISISIGRYKSALTSNIEKTIPRIRSLKAERFCDSPSKA